MKTLANPVARAISRGIRALAGLARNKVSQARDLLNEALAVQETTASRA